MDDIKDAQTALDAHHLAGGYEATDDPQIKLWHLLVALLRFCDAQVPRIDFDATLADARKFFIDEEREDDGVADEATPKYPLEPGGPQFSIGMLRPPV